MRAQSMRAAVEARPVSSTDVDDSPAVEDGPDRYPELDDFVPLLDGDDWPTQFGAARLGIP
ncbi:MAG: hypothetical protein M3153_09845 [Chloroflexota bacterium]|nr:hypothetical protein [Chloroflexota bacterium]